MSGPSHCLPGLLVPVWRSYRWLVPILHRSLGRCWPGHPVPVYVGIGASEVPPGGDWAPVDGSVDDGNWSAVLREGVREMTRRGHKTVYLVAEEHVPMGPCHREHLAETLPRMMRSLPAVYLSLMGWDNRRFTSRSPVLGATCHRLKNLSGPGDPRFHLHPALWRTETLAACCDVALEDDSKHGSAWHFEKCNDRDTAHHPASWREQCYQIHAASLSRTKFSATRRIGMAVEQFVYRRLQGLYPRLPGRRMRELYARAMHFDDVFCDGPYPMCFSGIMAKGDLNPYCVRFLKRHDPALLQDVLAARARRG